MTLFVATSSCNLATNHNPGGMGWANRIWLAPSKYDYRKPWFWSLGNGLEDQQFVKDAEIQMAHRCGVDAFNYQYFPESMPRAAEFASFPRSRGDIFDGANQDYLLHLASPYRNLAPFCISLGGSAGDWPTQVTYLVNLFQQSCYLRVGPNRPVVGLLFPENLFIGYSGRNLSQAQADLATLRSACISAGLGNPFMIGQNSDINGGMPNFTNLALNSASLYTPTTGPAGESWAAFSARVEASWDTYHAAYNLVVPSVSGGIDYRPISDVNGLPGSYSLPGEGESIAGQWQVSPTVAQFGQHLKNAFAWHPEFNYYDMVFNYSWSEPTECGRSLRPCWGDGGLFLQQAVALALQRQWDNPRALRAAGVPVNSPAILH